MQAHILDILISPDDRAPLFFEKNTNRLVSKSSSFFYEIIKGVPVLLPQNIKEKYKNAAQHDAGNSRFHYADHYQKDSEIFDYGQATEDAATRHENRRLHEAILAQILRGAKNILDVGCGNAWLAGAFQNSPSNIFSFDVSTVNTIKAKEKYPSKNHFAVTGDVYALPFKKDSFDCIVSVEVIEHVPDPALFLRNLLDVLKPGGTLIIATPYNEAIQYHLCVHCNRPTPENAHLHSFDENKILALAPNAISSAKAFAFSNKYLTKMRTHILLKYLPFQLWFFMDKIVNWIFDKRVRLMMVIVK